MHSRESAYVALPTQSRLERFIDRNQIAREISAIWDALPPTVRGEIEDANYWLNEATATAVVNVRDCAPHSAFPDTPSPDAMPAAWCDFMRAKRQARRKQRAAERERERRAAAHRRAQSEVGRTQRDARIVALHRRGRSRASIARELGVSSGTVTKALAKAGIHQAGGMNDYSRAAQVARIDRCGKALDMQRSGLTRVEIAHALGVSAETVKLLLRDARFYESPEDNQRRLDLAVIAHQHQWTRAALDDASKETKRAVADAQALQYLRPDLLDE